MMGLNMGETDSVDGYALIIYENSDCSGTGEVFSTSMKPNELVCDEIFC